MSHLKTLNSFLSIFRLSLLKYKGFIILFGRKLIFVTITCSLALLRFVRITQKRIMRRALGFVRGRHISSFAYNFVNNILKIM